MRINLYLAQSLGMSRRTADAEILDGRVKINTKKAKLGDQVMPGDEVKYKGVVVGEKPPERTTIMLHKPVGYITSRKRDETKAPTVMELLPKELQHLKPIGRLDKESSGLLLLTDDGDLLYKSTHPKFSIEKEYLVTFVERLDANEFKMWQRGMRLPDGFAKADSIVHETKNLYRVVLHQGLTRQIRRMAGKTGNAVESLVRVRTGNHTLGKLKVGEWVKV